MIRQAFQGVSFFNLKRVSGSALWSRWQTLFWQTSALALAYYLSARLGMLTSLVNGSVSPVWPAAGIALAATYIYGYRMLLGTALGSLIFGAVTTDGNLIACLGTSASAALEAFLAVFLVRKFIHHRYPLQNASDVFKYFLFGGLIPAAVGALGGMLAFCLGNVTQWEHFGYLSLTFALGDFMGAVVVGTLFITLFEHFPTVVRPRIVAKVLLMLLVIITANLAIFLVPLPVPELRHALVFLCVPLLIWPAFRFEQTGAVVGTFLTNVIALYGATHGGGPFDSTLINNSLLMLQFFMGVTTLTVLVLGAAVSERREVERSIADQARELARSNADLEQFAYVASHDLQEPLRMVATYCQLLERKYANSLDEDAHIFLHHAVDGAKRMKELIQDLLTYSRAGRGTNPFVPTNFEQALNEAVHNVKVAIDEKQGVVTHGPLPTVAGDPSQITLLFQNLIANSIKYCDGVTPKVHISSELGPNVWTFSVKDNGIGIESEHRTKIFMIFQRLHSREKYSGTGIGLAICKKIVQYHGGDIWVDSEVGKGSVFNFQIPLKGATNRCAPLR